MADPNERAESENKPDASETEASESSGVGEGAPAQPAAKKKAKASADPQQIRDRNRRIREEAAEKRRTKREADERRIAPARNLDTSEIVDDALARSTHAAATWLKRNFNIVQWTILLLIVGGVAYQIYSYRHGLAAARVTDELARALNDQDGRVGQPDNTPDQYTGLADTRSTFADDAARLKAAASSYEKAEREGSSTTSALASLGLAGILFDQGKYKEAQAEYEKVKASKLAAKDPDARARAIEGVGLSMESDGQVDAALKAFRELGNADIPGFNALGEYHQARLLLKKGEREQAKTLLTKAMERLSKADEADKASAARGSGFLGRQVRELLATVDPKAVPRSPSGLTPEQIQRLQSQIQVPGSNGKIDQKKLNELLQKLSKQAPPAGSSPAPSGSSGPAPAGSAP